MTLRRSIGVLVLLCGFCGHVQAQSLTGMWSHQDGHTYAIRHEGDEVWWLGKSADDGKGWTHIFHGKINGNQLTGRWVDVPPAKNRGSGTMTLELVKEGDLVVKLSGPGVNGVIRRISPPEAEPKPKPFSPEVAKAWTEIKAVPCWYHTSLTESGGSYIRFRDEGFPRELPAFRLRHFPADKISKLPQPEQPFVLYLNMLSVGADEVKALIGFKQLRILCIHESHIAPEAMRMLSELKQVEHVSLDETNVSDDAAKELAGVKHLKYLNLNSTNLSDAGAKALADHTGLESLMLRHTKITDAVARDLVRMKQLRRLNVSNNKWTDAGVKELAELKDLEWLSISNLPVTDASVKALTPLKKLEHLNLYGTKVSNDGMKDVATLRELRHLDLGSTPISNKGVETVFDLPKLRYLNIHNTKTENGLQYERKKPGLRVYW